MNDGKSKRPIEVRIPFLSALSMLEAVDGQHRSYMEIANALRIHSASTSENLRELWRPVVFTVLVSNTERCCLEVVAGRGLLEGRGSKTALVEAAVAW